MPTSSGQLEIDFDPEREPMGSYSSMMEEATRGAEEAFARPDHGLGSEPSRSFEPADQEPERELPSNDNRDLYRRPTPRELDEIRARRTREGLVKPLDIVVEQVAEEEPIAPDTTSRPLSRPAQRAANAKRFADEARRALQEGVERGRLRKNLSQQ